MKVEGIMTLTKESQWKCPNGGLAGLAGQEVKTIGKVDLFEEFCFRGSRKIEK